MPDFGIMRGFSEKLFSDKLYAGQLPTKLGGALDADAVAFFGRVQNAGGTLSVVEQLAINQLVLDMKSTGIWTKMKAIYPMVGASAAACSQNLKSSSFTGTFSSGWTFASTGVTGNGTSAFMNTNLNLNSVLTLNSTHQSLYIRNTGNLGVDDFSAVASATSGMRVIVKDSSTDRFVADQYSSSQRIELLTGVPDSRGFFTITRENSSFLRAKRNNVALGINANSSTGTLPNLNIYLGGLNNSGVAVNFSARQYAFASLGDGLTDTEETNFYTAVQAFQTTLSRQV